MKVIDGETVLMDDTLITSQQHKPGYSGPYLGMRPQERFVQFL